jgi:hypothetical protein
MREDEGYLYQSDFEPVDPASFWNTDVYPDPDDLLVVQPEIQSSQFSLSPPFQLPPLPQLPPRPQPVQVVVKDDQGIPEINDADEIASSQYDYLEHKFAEKYRKVLFSINLDAEMIQHTTRPEIFDSYLDRHFIPDGKNLICKICHKDYLVQDVYNIKNFIKDHLLSKQHTRMYLLKFLRDQED